jgi:hypothetical protein
MLGPIARVDPGFSGYSIPQKVLCRQVHVGTTLMNKLIRTGEVDSYVLGSRIRHIVLESWCEYVGRCKAGGIPRDPAAKAAAAAAYKISSQRSSGGKTAALARSGWTGDGRPGRSPNPESKSAARSGKASPPAEAAPKKTSTSRRSVRTSETDANV